MATELILGTAGHIDHGKTALVQALTGKDTDRLPEEKRRGITIELGFAELEIDPFRLGIVDVPGHERFVRQMLAGATGMNLAMLVVAADDSVKPQTREHLDVLRLLDLPAGVIAITKCDLVEPDWLELVEEEIRELVIGTFLERATIVRTSTSSGEGLEELKSALGEAATISAATLARQPVGAPFRMAIDRGFTVEGHGTVVTGSVASGSAKLGDVLVIQPQGTSVRVRGLHNHDRPVAEVHRGQRAAINLAGVRHGDIHRGHELASPDHLQASQLITVDLHVLGSAPRPLKTRSRVRVHVGTAEIFATVILLGEAKELKPNQSGWVQLTLREPAAVIWNQPLIIRAESPVVTVGGGRVLVPSAKRIRKLTPPITHALKALRSDSAFDRAHAATYFVAVDRWKPENLARLAGVENPDEIVQQLLKQGDLAQLDVTPQRQQLVHVRVLEEWHDRITQALKRMHEQFPLKLELDRPALLGRFAYVGDDPLLAAILGHMESAGKIRLTKKMIALVGHKLQLSPAQESLRTEITQRFKTARFQPPTVTEYKAESPEKASEITKLIELSAATGELVHIEKDMYIHRESESEMRTMLRENMPDEGMTLSSIRELLGTTRKFAVPFCEYLDRSGFTKRQGDIRLLQ
jgi:selenocysteine-specific elongation factor